MSVFRFAPSPNGYLHLGHALSALLNADMAKAAGGRLLLRIEDIDEARCRPEYEAAIYEDLAWLGLAWEKPVRRQSEHFADYRAALARLDAMGLIYPSFESRAEIAALVARASEALAARSRRRAALSGRREAACRRPNARAACDAGEPYALRLDMAAALDRAGPLTWNETGAGPSGETGAVAADPAAWGDVDSGPQGHADQLSPRRGGRRRRARRHRRGARAATCSTPPACTGCCRACSACPRRAITTTGSILDADGANCRNRRNRPACANCARKALTPADIRRLVGLA